MTTVYDVPTDKLVDVVTEKLTANDKIVAPDWAGFVTTGIHREKPPVQDDWWQRRAAAVLRKVYTQGPIGTERLRAEFGGPRDRGSRPNRAAKGSGSIVREILQQLEAAGFVANEKGKGRRVTAAGQKLLDNSAHEVKQKVVDDIPALAKY